MGPQRWPTVTGCAGPSAMAANVYGLRLPRSAHRVGRRALGVLAVSSLMSGLHHDASRVMNGRMHTTSTRKAATPMTTMTDPTLELLEASERLEQAEADRRVAELRYTTLVADAPLRFKVEAIERLRRADAERDAARAAYEAAQDVDCPEA